MGILLQFDEKLELSIYNNIYNNNNNNNIGTHQILSMEVNW